MSKDARYRAVKALMEKAEIKGLKDVFMYLPISVLKVDMKVNYNTLRRKIDNSSLLTVRDIISMAKLFEVDESKILALATSDINSKTKRKTTSTK